MSYVTVIGALSAAGLVLSVAVLIATVLEAPLPRLTEFRWSCLILTGSLVCANVMRGVPSWSLMLSIVGVAISLQAAESASWRLALDDYDELEPGDEDPVWWAEFEQAFRRYAAR